MRRVRLALEARDRLGEQLDYLIARGAIAPAQALKARTDVFLNRTHRALSAHRAVST